MKQVFMRKNPVSKAQVATEEVPAPRCGRGSVLLANGYSLISAGTESAAVKRNMKDMVVKAMTDPELRESVKDMLLKDGIQKTADRVHYETTKWTPLGYSGAGVAIEVGDGIEGIAVGDRVAYGGEGHAEIIRVAKNLCVKVPDGVELDEASFVAVGSIALQAARRTQPEVGDVVAVLGLGLVGQLVSQLLQAAGAQVIGSDVLPARLKLAESLGLEKGYQASDSLPDQIKRYTEGLGADRVVICASTSSPQVIQQAVAMARDRAQITVVGMVNLEVPCEEFYRKELKLVTSRSYGPGRYDAQYEQHGVDYPIGYVRWTEKRNMAEFLRLVQIGKVQLKPLISHRFELAEAASAFETLMEHPNDCLAIVLRYQDSANAEIRTVTVAPRKLAPSGKSVAKVAVAGCGAFARQFHLPNIEASEQLQLETLVASTAQSAKEMAARYRAASASTDLAATLANDEIDALMVFTRDNSHAPMTLEALAAGKHVFCEKPLATTEEDCQRLAATIHSGGPLCMVGFNRRFAPLVRPMQQTLCDYDGPATLQYRVNAGKLPPDHWTFDPQFAAGRIVGEVCHFIDLAYYLIDSEPVEISAYAAGDCPSLERMEDVSATLRFADGSVATILYTSQGHSSFPKERVEIFRDGVAMALDDFQSLTVRGRTRLDFKNRRGDKGHGAEMEHFAQAILGKTALAISQRDGIRACMCCLKLFESARRGEPLPLDAQLWNPPADDSATPPQE